MNENLATTMPAEIVCEEKVQQAAVSPQNAAIPDRPRFEDVSHTLKGCRAPRRPNRNRPIGKQSR